VFNLNPDYFSYTLSKLALERAVSLQAHSLAPTLRALKQKGFSDRRLARQLKTTDTVIRNRRRELGVRPVYKRVDTCAAEFATNTAYMYSTYEAENSECEAEPTTRKKIMVLGGGPNRIGQGIEFDYCCVHAALALREEGSRHENLATVLKPVVICGLTTITGFGSLVFARNPALSGLGLVCAVGVFWCLATSLLFLIPASCWSPQEKTGDDAPR
jgi:hypothetical protein